MSEYVSSDVSSKNVQVLKEVYTGRSLVPTQMSILMDVLVKSVSVCEREERIVKREEREKTRKTGEKRRNGERKKRNVKMHMKRKIHPTFRTN